MFLEKREKNALTGNLTLNGFSLDCVKELKYLGVVLDSKFCWKQHVLHLSNKCEKNLLGLNKVARNSFGIKSNVSFLIYKQGTVPFICYGSQIWGSALKKKKYIVVFYENSTKNSSPSYFWVSNDILRSCVCYFGLSTY
ncbi:reverse transcriptase domain-containing protein [Trichonephila clavipes]|nr:reverse transcriptase domain-containing protein [Trichonephila clavipes]